MSAKNGDAPPMDAEDWNPYESHGDRYRLARACGMEIDFMRGIVGYSSRGKELGGYQCWETFTLDDDASEAEVIVNAAADIGRAMK